MNSSIRSQFLSSRLPLLLAAAGLLAATQGFAQTVASSTIVVEVSDASGAVVKDAKILVTNPANGLVRDAMSGGDGAATFAALPLAGTYNVSVSKDGFATEEQKDITLRAGETATLKVKLTVGQGKSEVTVFGTVEGVRSDPEIGKELTSKEIDETQILGRKVSTLPLLNSAFRQAKGTGDLFVNTTYVVTGVGGRRETTVTLDGGSDDESWGRQTGVVQMPIGAVQEMSALTNAFSAEFGWTAGPALNVITKSGSNTFHGEGIYMLRPSFMETKSMSTDGFCPPSVTTCVTPTTLTSMTPPDTPDVLNQISADIGGPIVHDKTFFFGAVDVTRQDRTVFLSNTLPTFVLPADGSLSYKGHYRQELADLRLDHHFSASQITMLRANTDQFYDDNPQDAVGGTSAPTVARRYSRRGWSLQANHTSILSATLLNEARFDWLDGTPVTNWSAPSINTSYTRTGSAPFTIGQSRIADLYSRQATLSDSLVWSSGRHSLRIGASAARHGSGGFGGEPGTALLGTFTFLSTTTAPFSQLTLANVQQYTQPINFGITTYNLNQWLVSGYVQDSFRATRDLTLDLGLRYDYQSLTGATKNFEPRVGFGWHPGGQSRFAIRAGYGLYYTQIRSNEIASALTGGLDGMTTYTATPGQLGFPTCLTGACLPVPLDPRVLPASELPARDITILPGKRQYYEQQFTRYGLNFDALPFYPDHLDNPRSQVLSSGVEFEPVKGLFVSSDYIHQHWSGIDRTVDLNAPSPWVRTAPGQVRTPAAANATRPILPVAGGVRQVNVVTNLGLGDYNGWQNQIVYRGVRHLFASLSYSLGKSTDTSEPDGNGIAPNDANISTLGEQERGPSLLDQRNRIVFSANYELPLHITVGTLTTYASARPFNATTGVDNNGDGSNNDRPVINGAVIGKSAFMGTPTYDFGLFAETRIRTSEHTSILFRVEGFNLTNHPNILGRAQTVYGDTGTPNSTFGQLVAATSAPNALPALTNIDPARMFQLQLRFQF